MSELSRAAGTVVERMDAYDNFAACAQLTEFVDALSNWYVRRSRDRFWGSEKAQDSTDKSDAYWTLYECLLTTAKLIAPFTPFIAEALWQNLAVAAFRGNDAAQQPRESVHLCDYPAGVAAEVDEPLSERMALVREIVSLGHSARMGAKLKVRQPLRQVEVVTVERSAHDWLVQHQELIGDELNVKRVEFIQKADQYITYTVLPDLKKLGPRLGKRLPAVRKWLAEADGGRLLGEFEAEGKVRVPLPDGTVELDAQEIQVRLQAKEGWAAAQGKSCVVVLSTELTPELIAEGLARELVRAVQDQRKAIGCEFTDRIVVGVQSDSPEWEDALQRFADYIRGETLAVEIQFAPLPGVEAIEVEIGDRLVKLWVAVARRA